ncbi:MAG TPA: TonB family protein [Chitinophagaceae bacterium]
MKPETILHSDMLDIVFENRNKAYGAYALRRNYNQRLFQALGATTLLVAGFAILQFVHPEPKQLSGGIDLGDFKLRTVVIENDKPIVQPKPIEKPEEKKIRTETNAPPVITKTEETTVAEQAVLDRSNIGTTRSEGEDAPEASTGGAGNPPANTGTGNAIPAPAPVVGETGPLTHAAVMPAFNGNLIQYLLRNIRQPNDLDEGERIVVRVRFVVNADGEISNAEVIQSGRTDLDQEVLRVVKKMPRWKPGVQDGVNVPVYFNLPVTFVSHLE